MPFNSFPSNLDGLHIQEELFRGEASKIAEQNPKLLLHLNIIERAMSLAKVVIDYPTEDENFKVIKMLSIRMFNSFGASLKIIFSGYHQNGGLIMRDILETVFLIDLFSTDHTAVERWRFADKKVQRDQFSPAAVRKILDKRDSLQTRKREEVYRMFSELAAHPNMHSQHMLRPEKNGDIVTGPFMEVTSLEAGISELGKLAVQAGEIMNTFLPLNWDPESVRESFLSIKQRWIETFHRKP